MPWFESVAEAERRAKRTLPASVFKAIRAGTERGLTLADNVAAFSELANDIKSGAYPERRHLVDIPKGELDQFLRALESE